MTHTWFFERTFASVADRNVMFDKAIVIHVKCLLFLSDIGRKYNAAVHFLLKLSIVIFHAYLSVILHYLPRTDGRTDDFVRRSADL